MDRDTALEKRAPDPTTTRRLTNPWVCTQFLSKDSH
jgi:hypothetical protein